MSGGSLRQSTHIVNSCAWVDMVESRTDESPSAVEESASASSKGVATLWRGVKKNKK